MEQVFVSFRSDDTADEAFQLLQLINQEFGGDTAYVFKVANDPGEAFAERLRVAVSRAKVVIALIGPRWSITTADQDWVLAELEDALDAGIAVIPVLVRGASLPSDVASRKLQHCLQRTHYLTWDELVSADGARMLFERLTRRYRVRKAVARHGPMLSSSLFPNVARLVDPRQLLLHGAHATPLRMVEASFLFLLASYATFSFLNYVDYTEAEINLKIVTLMVLSLVPVALVCFLLIALPFLLLRREHLADAFIASLAAVAAFLVVTAPPSILIEIQLKTDYGLGNWHMQVMAVDDDREAVFDLINRLPDYVEYAFAKLAVLYVVGLICFAIYARWTYKMARVLRILLRTRYTSVYFFGVLLVTPFMGMLVQLLRVMPSG